MILMIVPFFWSQVLPWTLHSCFSCYAERREGLIPHKHCLLLLNTNSLCCLRVEESLMLPGIKSQLWKRRRPCKITFVALNQAGVQSR